MKLGFPLPKRIKVAVLDEDGRLMTSVALGSISVHSMPGFRSSLLNMRVDAVLDPGQKMVCHRPGTGTVTAYALHSNQEFMTCGQVTLAVEGDVCVLHNR